jgi:hypothetical protein
MLLTTKTHVTLGQGVAKTAIGRRLKPITADDACRYASNFVFHLRLSAFLCVQTLFLR